MASSVDVPPPARARASHRRGAAPALSPPIEASEILNDSSLPTCPSRTTVPARKEKGAGLGPAPFRRASLTGRSARAPAQDAEERLDVGVGADVPVAVEVGGAGARGGRAVAGDAGKERLDVGVRAHVPVAVEV